MINIEATIRWKGYNPTDLNPRSNKKVWANCDKCGIGRWIYFYAYRDLCKSCVRIGKINHMFGKPVSEETREKIRQGNLNKRPSKESRIKMSKSQTGKTLSEEHKQKLRESKLGVNNHRWNGGNKLRNARSQAKRKHFGFITINKPQTNFEGHHLDFEHVIFIPKELHRSITHSNTQNINMEKINDVACDWYLNEQGVIIK